MYVYLEGLLRIAAVTYLPVARLIAGMVVITQVIVLYVPRVNIVIHGKWHIFSDIQLLHLCSARTICFRSGQIELLSHTGELFTKYTAVIRGLPFDKIQ